MRKRLLLLCFSLSLCAYAFALDSGKYLVRNVATGKYWGAANKWGTQASLVSTPEYVTWVKLEDGNFHLESQVDNGGTAYYFNGDYMDNDTPIALTIKKRFTGYYTISNGEIYYGYDGNSTVLGKTETNFTSSYVQWEIISLEDATTLLANATQDTPKDATFLIADPNFGRNNRHYNEWTFEASNKNNEGNVSNYCVESWHAEFAMSQTIHVPNGVYALTAQGFYRQDGNDDEHLPVFFLNNATRTFPVRAGIENSMSDASESFTNGLYTIEPIYITVSDGTLSLGARLENNTKLWCIWDNFTLMYYGAEANADQLNFYAKFGNIIAEANELQNTEGVTAEGQSKINDALAAYNGIDAYSSESDQQSVENQLRTAINYIKEGLTLTERLALVYARYGERLSEKSENDNTLKALLLNVRVAISTKTYESNGLVEEWIKSLTTARQQYYSYEYRYWFDNDESTERTGFSSRANWSFDADISNMEESFHSLHIQVLDKDNNLSSPITKFFVKSIDTKATQSRYWFDDDIDNIKISPQVQGIFDIDVSQLEEGFHIIRYQLVGTNGDVSQIASRSFYKVFVPSMSSWRCWFDNDYTTVQTGTDMNKTLLLDVTQLSDGYHALHLQVEGGAQAASTPITKPFIKVPQTKGVDYLTCLCMIDDQLYKQEKVSSEGGIVNWNFDVSSLPQGFHRIFIQIVTPSGAATSSYQSFFLRSTTTNEMADMKCVYAIDGAEFYTNVGTLADGAFHFDLDVSSIEDGLHRITYMLSNGSGISTKAQTQFFTKIPLGGNGITEYWYWLNDQADSDAKKVTLSKRQDPFSLISLLPVESQPIRSSLFQFRIEQDKPVLYAKNDFHIRFYDASGRFTDVTKQFVDENVKQEVTEVTLLESGIRATTSKPEENVIKWYKVNAVKGDSLSFKLDRAATIQLFSPSGEEVYCASGAESVKWGGCHAEEDGTFYVALHDVTAQNGNDISIDYNHIDKYAVLRQDVNVVGNGGCSTITFEGNGFKNLYAVDFYIEQGDSIHHVDIGHESDATTSVTFDFSGANIGMYNAKFYFADEDKVFNNMITVENAKDIELETTVTYPSTFLRGTSVTYTVNITNKGNMTAYLVPLELKIKTNSVSDISHVKFGGQLSSLKDVIDDISNDSIYQDVVDELLTIWHSTGDLSQFAFVHDSLNNVCYGISFAFMNLPPCTTREITVTVKSASDVYLSAFMTSEWNPVSNIDSQSLNSRRTVIRKASVGEWLCCYRERVECVADVVGSIISALPGVPPNLNCGYQIGNTAAQALYDIGCSEGSPTERLRKYAEQKGQSLISRLRQNAIDCVMGYFFGRINSLRNDLKLASQLGNGTEAKRLLNEIQTLQAMQRSAINKMYNSGNIVVSAIDCVSKFRTSIPGCPPNPGGGGGSSTPVNSYDPNEIYGYIAESGSKAIKDEQTDVYYTIQFENDTTFATAAAHDIYLTDTLDAKMFDFSTFAPTRVKIGEKSAELKGDKNFVTTIDMRPEINAIAQVEGTFDDKKGVAKWHFCSLDPMTMEPTDDPLDGILPVNVNGKGIGEVSYNISLKPKLIHGTEVNNRAGIVFDQNDVIMTPTWTNIIDRIAPESHVTDVKLLTDTTATVSIEASDELSGPWRYDVYVQYGPDAPWWKMAENVPVDTTATVKIYPGINHGFYVVVTDSAGNVERKEAKREFTLDRSTTIHGDVNGDGVVNGTDIQVIINLIVDGEYDELADINKDGVINGTDIQEVINIIVDGQ